MHNARQTPFPEFIFQFVFVHGVRLVSAINFSTSPWRPPLPTFESLFAFVILFPLKDISVLVSMAAFVKVLRHHNDLGYRRGQGVSPGEGFSTRGSGERGPWWCWRSWQGRRPWRCRRSWERGEWWSWRRGGRGLRPGRLHHTAGSSELSQVIFTFLFLKVRKVAIDFTQETAAIQHSNQYPLTSSQYRRSRFMTQIFSQELFSNFLLQ